MKKIFTLFILLCACSPRFIFAQTFQFDSIANKELQIGKLMLKGDAWVIRVEMGNSVKDYYPINLEDNFKTEGQEVVFSGAIGRSPQNVRLPGIPLKLNMLRKLYKTKPKDKGNNAMDVQTPKNASAKIDSVGYINKGFGKIIKTGDTYLIEQNDNGNVMRFVPDYLPDDFKEIGLKITFSGIIGTTDPKVKAMGRPLQLKEIMSTEENAFDKSKIQEPLKDYYPLDSIGFLAAQQGIIKKAAGSDNIFIIEMNNGTKRYLPLIIPDEFKNEGMIVIVSGVIGKIPANVRMAGTPFEIKTIEKGK